MNLTFPAMHGLIDRRILVNFRVRPEAVLGLLPHPFRPKLVRGWAMAGLCLIRLKDIRPRGFPASFGVSSENAAHRIAVEWDDQGITREGVFIPRRDTSSRLQSLVGGRGFSGLHQHARFEVAEPGNEFHLRMEAGDDQTLVEIHARLAERLSAGSVFTSLAEASEFFARGAVGYSATETPGCCDGLELRTEGWAMEPLEVMAVKSSFFDDQKQFPHGALEFDCALLMRNLAHEWRMLPQLKG